jgi:hypothetical protein
MNQYKRNDHLLIMLMLCVYIYAAYYYSFSSSQDSPFFKKKIHWEGEMMTCETVNTGCLSVRTIPHPQTTTDTVNERRPAESRRRVPGKVDGRRRLPSS